MEFENMDIKEVEEVMDVIEDVAPKKNFKLGAGTKGAIVGILATVGLFSLVVMVKKVGKKKAAEQEETECDETEDESYDYDPEYNPEDSDVEDE